MTVSSDDETLKVTPESNLEFALEQYLLAAERGDSIDSTCFVQQYPEHRDELLDFIQIDRQFRSQRMGRPGEVGPEKVAVQAPASFGDYETLGEISRGGMGIVLRARHRSLRRDVAIKVLIGGSFSTEEANKRFRREAAAAARLSHPNIVPVYETGEISGGSSCQGQLWYAMALVKGIDLARRIDENLFDPASAARLMSAVADAVHYAHSKGVIHRDLKPANILLESDGTPRITDFGLSRFVDDEATQLTEAGQIFGTPSFMAPEQAAGRISDIGPGTDIYALGAVLYCMLTGKPPFRGHSSVATLQQVVHDTPVPPRLLNAQIPPDLEAVILMCLEKQTSDRYETAQTLQQDLERFLRGEVVSAARVNAVSYVLRVLGGVHNSESIEGWSRLLYQIAAVVFGSYLALQFLPKSLYVVMAVVVIKLIAMLAIVWKFRRGIMTPQNPVERTIWSLMIGYVMTSVTAEIMTRLTPDGPGVHAISSLTSCVILMVLGGQVWGACYAIAVAFLVAAVILTLSPGPGPLLFGTLWTLTFALLAHRCHRRAQMG